MPHAAHPVRLTASEIGRHYHERPYATLVVDGGYEEAGDQGRFTVSAGDLLLHPAFSAHRDIVRRPGSRVLDLPLPFDGRPWPGLGALRDPDLVIRTARRDAGEATGLLLEGLVAVTPTAETPADRLATALSDDPTLRIGDWAEANRHSPAWLARHFVRHYGVTSAMFRTEARARRAWRRIVSSAAPLAEIALACGFADQAHMTRAVGRLTGRPPSAWRP
jgi:AraC-like DNA-binding protein